MGCLVLLIRERCDNDSELRFWRRQIFGSLCIMNLKIVAALMSVPLLYVVIIRPLHSEPVPYQHLPPGQYVQLVAPERIWNWGAPVRCISAPPLFGSKSTISCFGEHFCDGQYSWVSFLFALLLLTVPSRAQPFVKVGARSPWSRRHCAQGASQKLSPKMFAVFSAIA